VTEGAATSRCDAPSRRRRRVIWGLVFVGIPVVVFGVPALLGVPWLDDDNLIQNFPLRSLVGTDLRAGHLPLWDPYLWSGSPLLAGFAAGAAYPATWLFAVLPHVGAWVVGQVASVVVAGSGMLVLLRGQGRSHLAAGLGAAAFSFGGFMAAQSVHIDLVEAGGWLVWAFVALDRIGRERHDRAVLGWVALLGVALGLMVLSGAAEPILDGGVALVVYGLWVLWRNRGRRLRVLVAMAGGGVLGGLVSAAQLLPGSLLQAQSQRGLQSYWYFTSGSMNKSLTVLLLDPLLLGSAHSVPLSYVGTFNLEEISGYVGIMAVMGALGLLAKRHRRHPESSQWWIWYVIAVVGLLLVWGGFTPLGHLEYLVPFYNRERLLARNWLEVDLALVVLFAAWVDHMLLSPEPAPDPPAGAGRRRWSSDVVLPLLPVAAVVILQLVLAAGGAWFPHVLHVPQPVSYSVLWKQDLLLCIPSAIALLAGWLVLNRARLARSIGRLVVVVLVADLVFFNVMVQTDPQLQTAVSAGSAADTLAAVVQKAAAGSGGRPPSFALYDPDRYYSAETNALGQPDLNVLRQLSSVQGYGPLVTAGYDDATGTHLQGNLTAADLSDGAFAGLDLGVLAVPPQYFVSMVVAPSGVHATLPGTVGPTPAATPLPPVAADRQAPSTPSVTPATSPANYSKFLPPSRSVPVAAGGTRTWFFGTVLAVRTVRLPTAGTAHLRVGLLGPSGTEVQWLDGSAGSAVSGTPLQLAAPGAPDASGVVVEQVGGETSVAVGPAVVWTAGQGAYRLDGGLRDVVTSPRWRYDGQLDDFALFEEAASGAVLLRPSAAGSARVLSAPAWGTERVEVRTTRPATLVRVQAYARGWQAALTGPPGKPGAASSLVVVRHGLLQAVRIPAGVHVVIFRYRPHRVEEGLALSALGALVAGALGGVSFRHRRRLATGPRRRAAAARPEAPRSARAPDDAAPVHPSSAPVGGGAFPPPRGP